jgi:hypothetical protein
LCNDIANHVLRCQRVRSGSSSRWGEVHVYRQSLAPQLCSLCWRWINNGADGHFCEHHSTKAPYGGGCGSGCLTSLPASPSACGDEDIWGDGVGILSRLRDRRVGIDIFLQHTSSKLMYHDRRKLYWYFCGLVR